MTKVPAAVLGSDSHDSFHSAVVHIHNIRRCYPCFAMQLHSDGMVVDRRSFTEGITIVAYCSGRTVLEGWDQRG